MLVVVARTRLEQRLVFVQTQAFDITIRQIVSNNGLLIAFVAQFGWQSSAQGHHDLDQKLFWHTFPSLNRFVPCLLIHYQVDNDVSKKGSGRGVFVDEFDKRSRWVVLQDSMDHAAGSVIDDNVHNFVLEQLRLKVVPESVELYDHIDGPCFRIFRLDVGNSKNVISWSFGLTLILAVAVNILRRRMLRIVFRLDLHWSLLVLHRLTTLSRTLTSWNFMILLAQKRQELFSNGCVTTFGNNVDESTTVQPGVEDVEELDWHLLKIDDRWGRLRAGTLEER